ncbi:hypothetical protein HPB47_019012 [Ixodes persulcatus]|uniref:Uncharacterized protein n=1 Tax=Ixodes persulcatus TaxID=34615 RepID=A0AC60QJ90_IXOPE|nr:hypothetical protein HPB47_019012 [Ixodes persulcatus]
MSFAFRCIAPVPRFERTFGAPGRVAPRARLRRSAAKVVIDLHIPNGHLQQQNRELQVCWAGIPGAPLAVVIALHERVSKLPGPFSAITRLWWIPVLRQRGHGSSNNDSMAHMPCSCISQKEQLVSLGDSKKLQKVVREKVGCLFSKQVQERFSLLGYRGKPRFKDAMMCKVVIDIKSSREGLTGAEDEREQTF